MISLQGKQKNLALNVGKEKHLVRYLPITLTNQLYEKLINW